MRSMTVPGVALGLMLTAGAAAFGRPAQRPQGATVGDVTELRAVVESVDARTREVLLRGCGHR